MKLAAYGLRRCDVAAAAAAADGREEASVRSVGYSSGRRVVAPVTSSSKSRLIDDMEWHCPLSIPAQLNATSSCVAGALRLAPMKPTDERMGVVVHAGSCVSRVPCRGGDDPTTSMSSRSSAGPESVASINNARTKSPLHRAACRKLIISVGDRLRSVFIMTSYKPCTMMPNSRAYRRSNPCLPHNRFSCRKNAEAQRGQSQKLRVSVK